MNEYDSECQQVFLKNQSQLFSQNVAETEEEAEAFLEDCMAIVCNGIKEVREYFAEEGMDIAELSDQELMESAEVFAMSQNRFLIVDA